MWQREHIPWAFAVTKFDGVFSCYQRCQVSVLDRRFEDHLGYHHQGPYVCHQNAPTFWRHTSRQERASRGRNLTPPTCPQQVRYTYETQGGPLTRRMSDDEDDDDDQDDPRKIGSIHTHDAADSPRRLHRIPKVVIVNKQFRHISIVYCNKTPGDERVPWRLLGNVVQFLYGTCSLLHTWWIQHHHRGLLYSSQGALPESDQLGASVRGEVHRPASGLPGQPPPGRTSRRPASHRLQRGGSHRGPGCQLFE